MVTFIVIIAVTVIFYSGTAWLLELSTIICTDHCGHSGDVPVSFESWRRYKLAHTRGSSSLLLSLCEGPREWLTEKFVGLPCAELKPGLVTLGHSTPVVLCSGFPRTPDSDP